MPKYIINKDYSEPETVEADGYHTNGGFIDFTKWNGEDTDRVADQVRAGPDDPYGRTELERLNHVRLARAAGLWRCPRGQSPLNDSCAVDTASTNERAFVQQMWRGRVAVDRRICRHPPLRSPPWDLTRQ